MTNFLTLLAALFFVPLAVLTGMAIIEYRQAVRRQTTESANEERLEKAA